MSGKGSKSSGSGGVQPGNPLAIAVPLLMGGKHREAIGTLHELLAGEPNNKDALQQHNEVARARQPAERLVAQEPEHPVLNRVLVRLSSNDIDELGKTYFASAELDLMATGLLAW